MENKNKNMSYFSLLFLKGLVMGACDVIPGVSGGTIAFITGIYETLLSSISAFRPNLLMDLKRLDFPTIWKKINGNFLLTLGSGIAISILSLAKIISYLLEHYAPLLWAFFFGLVLASSAIMFKEVKRLKAKSFVLICLGTFFGYYVSVLSPIDGNNHPFFIFISGFIAICAMILPGISGSFILLILGQYSFIIHSLISFDFFVITVFSSGCVCGLLSLSHLLKWMFKHYKDEAISLLIGIMLGSVNKLWPWKETLLFKINRHQEKVPVLQKNILPSTFEHISGQESMAITAFSLMFLGFAIVFIIHKTAHAKSHQKIGH